MVCVRLPLVYLLCKFMIGLLQIINYGGPSIGYSVATCLFIKCSKFQPIARFDFFDPQEVKGQLCEP